MSHTVNDQKNKQAAGNRRLSVGDRSHFAESQELSVLFALGVLGFTTQAAARNFGGSASRVFPRLAEQKAKTAVGTR